MVDFVRYAYMLDSNGSCGLVIYFLFESQQKSRCFDLLETGRGRFEGLGWHCLIAEGMV